MRKFLLMCLLFACTGTFCNAQGGGMRDPERMSKGLQSMLKLNDDQTAKIKAIYIAQNIKIDSLRKAGADGAALHPVMESSVVQIKALLTPDQAVAFQKMVDERRARAGQDGGN